MRSRKIVAQDRLQKQKEANEILQKKYDQMKDDYDSLKKSVNIADQDAAANELSKSNIEAITTSVNQAMKHSQDFQTAYESGKNEHGLMNSENNNNMKALEQMAMDAQRSFNKALFRLRGEIKSLSLQQRLYTEKGSFQ